MLSLELLCLRRVGEGVVIAIVGEGVVIVGEGVVIVSDSDCNTVILTVLP